MLRHTPALLLCLAMFLVPSAARASLIFDFSFNNASGNTAGPIAGTITLPDVCNPCSALDITLTEIGGHSGVKHTAPLSVVPGWSTTVNSFTVTAGAITDWNAEFFHLQAVQFSSHVDTFSLGQKGVSAPFYSTYYEIPTAMPPCGLFGCVIGITPVLLTTTAIMDTISFTAMGAGSPGPISSVPAPPVVPLLALGLVGMFAARRRSGKPAVGRLHEPAS